MSPDNANTSLAETFEDPFDPEDGSPAPTPRPGSQTERRGTPPVRLNSPGSDGEPRPLPPLPPSLRSSVQGRPESSSGLSDAAERRSSARRTLPSPPRAAGVSKSDILNMRDSSMSLEDRLRLMGIQDSPPRVPSPEKRSFMYDIMLNGGRPKMTFKSLESLVNRSCAKSRAGTLTKRMTKIAILQI